MKISRLLTFCAALLAVSVKLSACTGMLLKNKDSTVVSGRTVEFGIDLDMTLAVVPRGYAFAGDVSGGEGKKYISKYGVVGIYCFTNPKIMDGINEKGLVAAAFYFPGYAEYGKVTDKNMSEALSPAEIPNWILTQFATIEEVKKGLSSIVIAPSILEGWGPTPPPFHYVVYDKEGRSIAIEPRDGKVVVSENPIGIFTNSPVFDWHLTNLNNYINLSPYNVDSARLKGLELSAFGQGSGMLGIPGDFTPPSRFVRAAIFSSAATPSENSEQGVFQIFHLLNQFDIPKGSAANKNSNGISYDITWVTCVKDQDALKYYYKTYGDQTIKVADLGQFDLNAKKMKKLKLAGESAAIDVSDSLRD